MPRGKKWGLTGRPGLGKKRATSSRGARPRGRVHVDAAEGGGGGVTRGSSERGGGVRPAGARRPPAATAGARLGHTATVLRAQGRERRRGGSATEENEKERIRKRKKEKGKEKKLINGGGPYMSMSHPTFNVSEPNRKRVIPQPNNR